MYFKDKRILRDDKNKSKIAVLGKDSLFFSCYDDNVYESVLDDLRRDYINKTKNNPKWLYNDL